jgi:cation diffusion facilitator CzcD-associated flavoprotein CzcO
MDQEYERRIKATYAERRRRARETASGLHRDMSRQSVLSVSAEERARVLEQNWRTAGFGFIQCFSDILLDGEANRHVVEFIHRKITEQVDDAAVARALCPDRHPFGTKRPCVASDYYATYNRRNVTLVDLGRSPIDRITPTGIRTTDEDYPLDMLVFATGFDAMTGALMKMDIRCRSGQPLRDKWAEGPRTYLGLATSGFPNLFIITGPGSPSVLSNMMAAIEQHVDWIGDLLRYAERQDVRSIEATCSAEDAWVDHVNEMAAATLYPTADSWYLGANVPGKPRVFMPYPGGLRRYRHRCAAIAAAGYAGFTLSRVSPVTAAAL